MTLQRRVIPGSTYLTTRRCSERRRFLNPCIDVNQAYLYCLGYAATANSVDLHSFVCMGNHHHVTPTDREARLPEFFGWLHGTLARAINARFGHRENFWAGQRSYNAVFLGSTSEDDPIDYADVILEKMVYAVVNPVRAGLVKWARQWPGVNSIDYRIGQSITVERPRFFFRGVSHLPDAVTFSLVKPPGFNDMSDDEFDKMFRDRVFETELEIQAERKSQGKGFLGPAAVLRQSRFSAPKTSEVQFRPVPEVAASTKARRADLKERLRTFRAEYAVALDDWRAEDWTVCFPFGTYQLRRVYNVRCRGPD